jgi:protein SCO1/2
VLNIIRTVSIENNLTTKLKIIISVSIMTVSLLLISIGLFYYKPIKPPLIHGIIVPHATAIASFSILDHHNQAFTNDNLKGHWSLLSYGYTHCPDICPTTLNVLNKFTKLLRQQQKYQDLQVLFYSIDHKRDSVERMAEYMPFFNPNFIGLTHLENAKGNSSAELFEKSLGLISVLTPIQKLSTVASKNDKLKVADSLDNKAENTQPYSVGHGVMLYLINPQGRLQAVFKPYIGRGQIQYFKQQQLFTDYIKVREYFAEP